LGGRVSERCEQADRRGRLGVRGFMWAEQVICGGGALALLVAGAVALLVDAVAGFVDDIADDACRCREVIAAGQGRVGVA
jgi:hypothetical protein